ncbi:MAG: hypothetical protein R3Y35_04275 [Clostridia bacterium]
MDEYNFYESKSFYDMIDDNIYGQENEEELEEYDYLDLMNELYN